jgi:hypothetical protein
VVQGGCSPSRASHGLALALLVGFASLFLGARDCGSVDSSSGGVNAPCERDYDCVGGLSCSSGVCVGPPVDGGAAPEAGPRDASADG